MDLSSLGSPEVILSFLTAILAFLTLWFTTLKGPDIQMLSKTNASYTESGLLNRVLDSVTLSNLEFVFSNDGSRTGLISKIRAELEPGVWFAPFYRETKAQIVEANPGQVVALQSASQSVSIPPGENTIVLLACSFLTTEWKTHPRELDPSLSIGDAIRKSLDAKRGSFEQFVRALTQNQPVGMLSVSTTATRRTWLFRTILQDKVIATYALQPVPDKLVEDFRRSLALWDNEYPEFQRVVNDAVSEIRKVVNPIKSRVEYLNTPILDKNVDYLPTNEVDYWLQEVDASYPQLHALRKGLMMWHKQLGEALPKYLKAAREFNIEVDRFKLKKALGPVDMHPINEAADKVKSIVTSTVAAFACVETELLKIT